MTTNNPHLDAYLAKHLTTDEARNSMMRHALMESALRKFQTMAVYGDDRALELARFEYIESVEAYLDAYAISARKLFKAMAEGK